LGKEEISLDINLGIMLMVRKEKPQRAGKKQMMTKYCCFIWTHRPRLRSAIFWPKYRSNEDQVCQLLIEYINDKSLVTQEEIDYALCWREGPSPCNC
jgi:hypothetical protein